MLPAESPLQLTWQPVREDWAEPLRTARSQPPDEAFAQFQRLANSRMDFTRAVNLDKAIERFCSEHGAPASWPTMRLAVLSSSTVFHLLPGIRLGALRRGLRLEIFTGEYGMYRQEISDADSELYRFAPDAVLLCLDAAHVAGSESATEETAFENMRHNWRTLQTRLNCTVLQQTVLPVLPLVMGNNESRLKHAPAALIERVNHRLREAAEDEGIYLLAVDQWAAIDGIAQWYQPALWYRAKQEIHPRAANLFGDQVGRLLGALRGRSAKCLVLDLDNTLWGGVIGDDGLQGILLGQGSTVGEAHVALQSYAKRLSQRGIILAVCSKNDLSNAIAPFERHAEMILRREDIACFVANWQDKAENLRHIARTLNIGLDALVFVDDNPAERALIRRELPMVQVPELPDDAAEYVATLSAAGYFEAVHVTADDEARARQYRDNFEREELRQSATDMGSYLQALKMKLTWSSFDDVGLKRIVQLANKTNQFNLTTRRYTEAEIEDRMRSDHYVTLQLRLADVYGDNGMIALLVGDRTHDGALELETWLMSCRVLGRDVEQATLGIVVEQARAFGCTHLVGIYKPTEKNSMVRNMYERLGFQASTATQSSGENEEARWTLALDNFTQKDLPMQIEEAKNGTR